MPHQKTSKTLLISAVSLIFAQPTLASEAVELAPPTEVPKVETEAETAQAKPALAPEAPDPDVTQSEVNEADGIDADVETADVLMQADLERFMRPPPPDKPAPIVPSDDPLSFIESQIQVGEGEAAEAVLGGVINEIEQSRNRYHEELLLPLTLMGDALSARGAHSEALDMYGRARHIARVNAGLFAPEQLDVVYREAAAHRRVGDFASAGEREEYAFEVAARNVEPYDPKLLPSIQRLAQFYQEMGAPMAARTMYNRALRIHEANKTDKTEAALTTYRALASTYWQERFPPVYIDPDQLNKPSGPGAEVGNIDRAAQLSFINSFPAGERALQRVAEIQQTLHGKDSREELKAMIELADWHLMFGRTHAANVLYRHVFAELEAQGENVEALFGKPQLLWFPRPFNPKPPEVENRGSALKGVVNLTYDVSPGGRVRALKTVDNEGPKTMVFRVRRSLRTAVFRPALIEGEPVMTQAQRFAYTFPYFETIEPGTDTTVQDMDSREEPPEQSEMASSVTEPSAK